MAAGCGDVVVPKHRKCIFISSSFSTRVLKTCIVSKWCRLLYIWLCFYPTFYFGSAGWCNSHLMLDSYKMLINDTFSIVAIPNTQIMCFCTEYKSEIVPVNLINIYKTARKIWLYFIMYIFKEDGWYLNVYSKIVWIKREIFTFAVWTLSSDLTECDYQTLIQRLQCTVFVKKLPGAAAVLQVQTPKYLNKFCSSTLHNTHVRCCHGFVSLVHLSLISNTESIVVFTQE